jgi:hypothetical protein
MIAPDPVSRVVVHEGLGESHDRVGQRGRISGRLVHAGVDLRIDQLLHKFHGPGLDHAGARGQQTHRPVSLLLEKAAHGRGASERLVDAIEHGEEAGGPATANPAPFPVDEPLELVGDDRSEQGLARTEPAVDRRAAQTELARDHGQIDALAVQVLLSDHAEHVGP